MMLPPAPGPAQDPGYVASLRTGTGQLGATRRLAFALVMTPVLLWVWVPFIPLGTRAMPAWALLVVAGAVVVTMGLARLVAETVSPLAPRLGPPEARAEALVVFRSQVLFQVVVASTPVFTGFVMAIVAHSATPWTAGFILGWPLMMLALPTTTVVERIRQRLEEHGVTSDLWAGLLQVPAPTSPRERPPASPR
ncbi:MAG: hypothetical protein ACRDYU_13370 [Actinomycetes bacterium]